MFQAVDATRKTLALVVTLSIASGVSASPASIALTPAESPDHHWANNVWHPPEARPSLLPPPGPDAGAPQSPPPGVSPLPSAGFPSAGLTSAQSPQIPPPPDEDHRGIHVANWRWTEVGVFFTFTAFIVVTGLAKVGFHHAHWLSSRLPESCLMIIVGVAVGGILYLCGVPEPENKEDKVVPDEFHLPTFTPRLFFLILLPPVILESAYSLYNRAFAVNLYTVLLYAVVGTLFNTFAIGLLLYGLSEAGVIGRVPADGALNPAANTGYYPQPNIAYDGGYPGGYPGYPSYGANFGGYIEGTGYDRAARGTTWVWVTLPDCLVFSALISAVDPVAVLAIFQEIGVNQDLYYLLFGESLLNDAVTVVLYTTMVTFAELPEVRGEQLVLAVLAFFTVSLGGLSLGIVFGLVTALLTKTTREVRVVEPLAVLGIAYLSYLTAELFHFSGIISIIGCGLAQSHYALRNISSKSYTTVKYFTKMLSSTSDAIIFLFLGMVLVSDRHVWHTGFVIWTLVLCLVCRFIGVLLLTGLANLFRVKKINLQEQFIMGYGGLRGAIAFSLVEMLDEQTVRPRHVLLTTTLVVILFTIFFQGATIKPLVKLLNIEKSREGMKSLNEEISDNVIGHMMAGIEEITGFRGDFYIRRKWEYIDEVYLKRIFLRDGKDNSLTRLYEKLALTQHFAHLYGPVALVEDHKTEILHNGVAQHLSEEAADVSAAVTTGAGTEGLISSTPPLTPSPTDVLPPQRPGLPRRSSSTLSERFPGVQLRRRSPLDWPGGRPGSARPAMTMGRAAAVASAGRPASTTPATGRPPSSRLSARELAESSETLRKAFRANPFQKYYLRYNRNLIDDECQELSDQLKRRHLTARRITHMAALAGRNAGAASDPTLMGAGLGAAGALGLGLGAALGLGAPTTSIGAASQSPQLGVVPQGDDPFQRPRRNIESELDGMFPEELEGIGVILSRANQRASRQRPISTCSSSSAQDECALESVVTGDAPFSAQPPQSLPVRPHSVQPTSSPPILPASRGRSGAFVCSPSESEPLLSAAGASPTGAPPALPPKKVSSLAGITERSADTTPTTPGRPDKDENESSV